MNIINVSQKFNQVKDYWTPKIIGELNGQHVKLARLKGEFVWHSHKEEDELFLVLKGNLIMEFRDKTVEIGPGELIIVPKGVEHKPRTGDEEVEIMLFEPATTLHTGEIENERTVKDQEWI